MRIAAIAGRVVFDQVAREQHAGIGHPGDRIARGMAATQMHDLDPALAHVEGEFLREGHGRPGQAGNAFGRTEQAREAAVFRIPILFAALHNKAARGLGGQHLLRLVGRGAEHAHSVVMRQQHIFDRLVGHLADVVDHLAGHLRRRLGIDHHYAVVTDDHAGIGIALGGEGIQAFSELAEADNLVFGIGGGCKFGGGHAGFLPVGAFIPTG